VFRLLVWLRRLAHALWLRVALFAALALFAVAAAHFAAPLVPGWLDERIDAKAVLPVLEYAYLSSAQGPQIASKEGWEVLGMEFRVFLDFGCGAVDHRGAYRNPGA